MGRLTFCFAESQVLVVAHERIIEQCLRHLTPFFNISPDLSFYNDNKWRVTGLITNNDLEVLSIFPERELKIAHGSKIYLEDRFFVKFDYWPVEIEVRPAKKEAIIRGKNEEDVSHTLWRVIQQILIFTQEFIVKDFTLLHSSVTAHNEQTIAFVSTGAPPGDISPSRHGKSFALFSCLLRGKGFSFFTDDLLMIWIEENDVKIAGCPDYLGIYLQDTHRFPEVKGYGHYNEMRQYLLPGDLAKLGIKTSAGSPRRLSHIFFTNLQELRLLKAQAIEGDEAFGRIVQSVRYDHLYSDLYNPNWLDLPRKTLKQIAKSSEAIARALIEQKVKFFTLEGTGAPEDLVKVVENYL